MGFKSPRASFLAHTGFLDLYSAARRILLGPQVAIIEYHHVAPEDNPLDTSNVDVEEFEKQIAFLRQSAEILPLEVLADRLRRRQAMRKRTVSITFDDGFKDNYRYAYPILRKYNLPATVFLATGYIESPDTFWDIKLRYMLLNTKAEVLDIDGLERYHFPSAYERSTTAGRIIKHLSELPNREKDLLLEKIFKQLNVEIPRGFGEDITLTWTEIREMSNNGISFGAHTVTHLSLTQVTLENARNEIVASKEAIEEHLGKRCTSFAFPLGYFNEDLVRLIPEAGFTCAVVTLPRLINKNTDIFRLPRLSGVPNFYALKCNFSGLTQDYFSLLRVFGLRRGSLNEG